MNKKKILMFTVASLGVVSALSMGVAVAHGDKNLSLAEKIATQFDIDEDEVQAVIANDHAERRVQMQKHAEKRLQVAVDIGKLTPEQKDKIITKMKELELNHAAKHEEMKNKPEEERHAAMNVERDELKKWAQDNNIPTEYLFFAGRGHGGLEMGGRRGDGPAPDTLPIIR